MPAVYLEDFVVCKPPEEWRVNWEAFLEGATKLNGRPEAQVAFGRKVHSLVGISPLGTFLPPWVNPAHTKVEAEHISMSKAKEEAMVTLVGTAKQLLAQARVASSQVDIIITTCGIYCPTPSLASLLVAQLGLREDVIGYNLGGMGCSSGVIAIQLAQELLQAHPGKRVLLVAAEMVTAGVYLGQDVKLILSNVIFRSGGAAALISSRPAAARSALYRLVTTTRCYGRPDTYGAVEYKPDDAGFTGLYLSRELPKQAGRVLEKCVRQVAPRIMILGQKAGECSAQVSHNK